MVLRRTMAATGLTIMATPILNSGEGRGDRPAAMTGKVWKAPDKQAQVKTTEHRKYAASNR